MRKVLSFALLLLSTLALPSLPTDAATTSGTTQTVETFAASCVMEVALPGTVVGGAIEYEVSGHLKGLTFEPGPVLYDNKAIDLSGTEGQLLAQSFRGTATIPAVSGPATVGIAARGGSADLSGSFTVSDVHLGEKFAPDYLDVASNAHKANGRFSSWSPSLNTSLQGYDVRYGGNYTIVSLDAASGVADGSGSGSVTATKPAPEPAPSSGAAAAGLGLVLVGSGGLGLLRRRRPVPGA